MEEDQPKQPKMVKDKGKKARKAKWTMSFLRKCATSHDPFVEKGEKIAAALDELAEEDTVCFPCFMQARLNVFFVKAQRKAMTSMQQWREVYVQKECLAAVRCYLNWKKYLVKLTLSLLPWISRNFKSWLVFIVLKKTVFNGEMKSTRK